jgi:hypothetical protein
MLVFLLEKYGALITNVLLENGNQQHCECAKYFDLLRNTCDRLSLEIVNL